MALATWAVVALAAFCAWAPATRQLGTGSRSVPGNSSLGESSDGGSGADDSVSRDAVAGTSRSLRRSPLAWAVTAYFGMQSLVAYVVMGWMPEVFKGAGMDATNAGALLGVLLVVGVPINMVLPPLVTKTRGQSGWAVGLAVLAFTGLCGLHVAPLSLPLLWALLIGVGMSAFPLALVLISLRSRDARGTSQLSAMSQSIGYLVASTGPLLFGTLHDLTGGWSVSLITVMVIVVAQGAVGVFAGRPRTV